MYFVLKVLRGARRLPALFALLFLLAACSPGGAPATTTVKSSPTPTAIHDSCPFTNPTGLACFTPHALRVAYGVEPLIQKGYTGSGQTVVIIVSFGSPTLQQDLDMFDQQFGLPPITVQVISPLGTVPFDPTNKDMVGWAGETNLDVQIVHAVASGARIIVMTSPVSETEGTIGLPQFMQLEQYAVDHHLGQVFSQSWAASEVTLADSAGQQLVQSYANFYKNATTQQGISVVAGSGDNGTTDWANLAATQLSATPTVNFPADVPWVTAVGGTSLVPSQTSYSESAWSGSGGGLSQVFSEPDFQKQLPQAAQILLQGRRGLPDVAGDADPNTGMAFSFNGRWEQAGGTSAATPLWAAIIAIADQVAGHPLGFINPGLYKLGAGPTAASDFRDITSGSNAVNNGNIHLAGFAAQSGWDAVTGWGAPIANRFIPDLIAALH